MCFLCQQSAHKIKPSIRFSCGAKHLLVSYSILRCSTLNPSHPSSFSNPCHYIVLIYQVFYKVPPTESDQNIILSKVSDWFYLAWIYTRDTEMAPMLWSSNETFNISDITRRSITKLWSTSHLVITSSQKEGNKASRCGRFSWSSSSDKPLLK